MAEIGLVNQLSRLIMFLLGTDPGLSSDRTVEMVYVALGILYHQVKLLALVSQNATLQSVTSLLFLGSAAM